MELPLPALLGANIVNHQQLKGDEAKPMYPSLASGAEQMELETDSGWKFWALLFGFVTPWQF